MDRLQHAFEEAFGRLDDVSFEDLDIRDQVLVAIWGLEAEVNNGGFHQYYFNSAGNQAFFAATALDLIGASQAAGIVRQANTAFGTDGPARDRDQRQKSLTAMAEETWDRLEESFLAYPDDIAARLAAWLAASGSGTES